MKKQRMMLALTAVLGTGLALSSCGGTENSSESSLLPNYDELVVVSPTGAPTIALFDQGDNENWTSTTPDFVRSAFLNDESDVIIFDGVNGLRLNAAHPEYDYKLARWITGGNFYLVSTTHETIDELTSASTIVSFGENLLPDLVFHKLIDDYWNWETSDSLNIEYLSAVSDVSARMIADHDSADYYFIAEPVLTNVKSRLAEQNVEVHEIYNLREEWKDFSGQSAIPQAGLFVNGSHYSANKDTFDNFLTHIDENLSLVLSNPEEAKEIMDSNLPLSEQQARFGFNSNLLVSLQNGNANRFGVVDPASIEDSQTFVNDFMDILSGEGVERFADSLFL